MQKHIDLVITAVGLCVFTFCVLSTAACATGYNANEPCQVWKAGSIKKFVKVDGDCSAVCDESIGTPEFEAALVSECQGSYFKMEDNACSVHMMRLCESKTDDGNVTSSHKIVLTAGFVSDSLWEGDAEITQVSSTGETCHSRYTVKIVPETVTLVQE